MRYISKELSLSPESEEIPEETLECNIMKMVTVLYSHCFPPSAWNSSKHGIGTQHMSVELLNKSIETNMDVFYNYTSMA